MARITSYLPQLVGIRSAGGHLIGGYEGTLLARFDVRPTLVDQIRESQEVDEKLSAELEKLYLGMPSEYSLRDDGVLQKLGRVCVPDNAELKRAVLEEAHSSAYALHPGSTKMGAHHPPKPMPPTETDATDVRRLGFAASSRLIGCNRSGEGKCRSVVGLGYRR
ncbi:HIPL1 protein-like protein [Corchorus olitorius]|uniref:HIPL1 protein-like protein n=1 Tax=Corchorus olitorius TaxID=93759 RepID=A0A1R3IXH0_9ROSI|nr:HIPL1 protein-like protein [Corchorus olitorius]